MPEVTLPEPGYPAEIPAARTLDELNAVMLRCTRCELYGTRIQVVPGAGSAEADVFFVGEAPGAAEDAAGLPFIGRSGKLLDAMLEIAGLSRAEIFIANVVRSRPPENRNPRAREMRACAGWLREQIRIIEPSLVVSLGRFALQHFLPAGQVTQLRGRPLPIAYDGRPLTLYPLLHPAAVLRSPSRRPEYAADFRRLRDLLAAGR
jgi:uracil-DNA glycosylase